MKTSQKNTDKKYISFKTILMILLSVIFIASGTICLLFVFSPKGNEVEIISDGNVLYILDLSREKNREIIVEYKGRKNIIAVENGDIYMKEAECPDHTCIRTGRLSKSGVPIVCLPNRLIIRYRQSGDTDAAAS